MSNEQLMIFRLSLVSTQWVLAAKISWAISYGPYHMGKQSVKVSKCQQTFETNLEQRFRRGQKVGKTLDTHAGQIFDSMPHNIS